MTSAWFLLLLAIPTLAVLGFAKWYWHQDVTWREFMGGVATFGGASAICLLISDCKYHPDTETLSGAATKACHTPEWEAEWEVEVDDYETNSKGESVKVGSHYETRNETHEAEWWIESQIGKFDISETKWERMQWSHGKWAYSEKGYRPDHKSGDRKDYFIELSPSGNPAYPVNRRANWNNWLEGSDSILKMPEVSKKKAEKMGLPVYPEPARFPFVSNRRVGSTGVDEYPFEQFNARLGPGKRVNVVLVALGKGKSVGDAVMLRNYWRNGKKNDLVVVYDEASAPTWCYTFGWAKHDVVKFAMQAAVIDAGKVSNELLPEFERIIRKEFQPYPWKQYRSDSKPISTVALWITFIIVMLVNAGYVFFVKTN